MIIITGTYAIAIGHVTCRGRRSGFAIGQTSGRRLAAGEVTTGETEIEEIGKYTFSAQDGNKIPKRLLTIMVNHIHSTQNEKRLKTRNAADLRF